MSAVRMTQGAQASAREGHVSPSVKAFDRARIQHCQHRRSQRPRIDAGQLRAPSRARRLGLGDLAHKRLGRLRVAAARSSSAWAKRSNPYEQCERKRVTVSWLDELLVDPTQTIESLAIREGKSERSIRMRAARRARSTSRTARSASPWRYTNIAPREEIVDSPRAACPF